MSVHIPCRVSAFRETDKVTYSYKIQLEEHPAGWNLRTVKTGFGDDSVFVLQKYLGAMSKV